MLDSTIVKRFHWWLKGMGIHLCFCLLTVLCWSQLSHFLKNGRLLFAHKKLLFPLILCLYICPLQDVILMWMIALVGFGTPIEILDYPFKCIYFIKQIFHLLKFLIGLCLARLNHCISSIESLHFQHWTLVFTWLKLKRGNLNFDVNPFSPLQLATKREKIYAQEPGQWRRSRKAHFRRL